MTSIAKQSHERMTIARYRFCWPRANGTPSLPAKVSSNGDLEHDVHQESEGGGLVEVGAVEAKGSGKNRCKDNMRSRCALRLCHRSGMRSGLLIWLREP